MQEVQTWLAVILSREKNKIIQKILIVTGGEWDLF